MAPLSNSSAFVIHLGAYLDVGGGCWKEKGDLSRILCGFRVLVDSTHNTASELSESSPGSPHRFPGVLTNKSAQEPSYLLLIFLLLLFCFVHEKLCYGHQSCLPFPTLIYCSHILKYQSWIVLDLYACLFFFITVSVVSGFCTKISHKEQLKHLKLIFVTVLYAKSQC